MTEPELFEPTEEENLNPMRMENVEVFINNANFISITQEIEYQEKQIIVIHPSQIPLLCKWLTDLYSQVPVSEG